MTEPLRVKLNRLDEIAFLESVGGKVVTLAGQSRLDGKFAVHVSAHLSDPIEFNSTDRVAIVTGSGTDWLLQSVAKTNFKFTNPLQISDPSGPWLRCETGWLIQSPSTEMAMLSLDDSRVSLTPGGADPGAGAIVFPTDGGDQTESLTKLAHPENSNWVGFFVLPFEAGFVVHLGSLRQNISINHAIATDVLVHDDSNILFPISPTGTLPTSLIIDSPEGTVGAHVRTAADSSLMMAASAEDTHWSRLRLQTTRIEAAGGRLSVTRFRDSELWLGHVSDPAQRVLDTNALFTATNRLGYELELVPHNPNARLIYNDDSVNGSAPQSAGGRFYGLRLKGLGSRAGVVPILDADRLAFSLTTDGNPLFHIKAGFEEGSLLVPKLDPRNSSGLRVLDIPVSSQLTLRAESPLVPATSVLQLDTEHEKFVLNSPSLLSAPAGITAKDTGNERDSSYLNWELKPDIHPDVEFALTATGLRPADKWLDQFHTKDASVTYGLIEHPGTQLAFDGGPSRLNSARFAHAPKRKTEMTHTTAGGKEIVAYSAFFATLSWLGAKCISEGSACLDEKRFQIAFPKLDDETFKKFVKKNKLQDLQVVYFTAADGADREIHDFVDDNLSIIGGPPPEKFLWPFAAGLSVLLLDRKDPNGPYCDTIAAARMGDHKNTCVAFDLSAETVLDPRDLGYSEEKWKDLPLINESPTLWPRGAKRSGARLDPTDQLWRGVFLRDLPLFLPTPPVVGQSFPFLQNLIDGINKKLILDYGWRDESGPTWVGHLDQTFDQGRFTPDAWKGFLEMSILSVVLKGAAGAVVTAEATCAIRLNRLKDKATGDPLEFRGTFGLDLNSGGSPITRIDITQDGAPIATDSLPGFRSVALRRLVTDFKTAQFELLLTATPELANALPFLSSTAPQLAILSFNLQGDPVYTLSLALPKEVETNLFGRWQLTVQAISVAFMKDPADTRVELRIRGRLHLGIAEFASVGATLIITRDDKGVHFDVQLDSISGSLTVGQVKIGGGLQWRDGNADAGMVDLTGIAAAGKSRDIWGEIHVEDPGVLGSNLLAVRIGNRGEVSFWIAALKLSTDIPLGIGKLKNPALLLAHNADFDGKLEKVIADPTGSLLQVLRPDFSHELTIDDWLTKWQPSSSIGTTIAGSGYAHLQSGVAEAPASGTPTDASKLSSLLFNSQGLVRIDGVLGMLGGATMRFGLMVDYKKKRILAGLQAPAIKLPSAENPKYEIQAGYITVGVSFNGADPWLRVGIGWPERIGGTEFERDWSKATKVYISTMWPINTFWGGYLAELQKGRIHFGFAIRAGWTWSAQASIGGIVAGSAELGITLGGVFQFIVSWDGDHKEDRSFNAVSFTSPLRSLPRFSIDTFEKDSDFALYSETIAAAMDALDASLAALSGAELAMSAEIFGDIWGKGSVSFLGIQLAAIAIRAYARFRVCGSFSRGITQAKAAVGFEVSVTILCVTFHAQAEIDITLKDGDCPGRDLNDNILPLDETPRMFPFPDTDLLPVVS